MVYYQCPYCEGLFKENIIAPHIAQCPCNPANQQNPPVLQNTDFSHLIPLVMPENDFIGMLTGLFKSLVQCLKSLVGR